MVEFTKDCPVCQKQFASLIEYMQHLAKDHKDISPDKILTMNKEEKWKFSK
ncbi:MAG TPA: hypothetical protein VEJ68_02905 [Candidatus Bathyarchaeia archaeon]|nr:hypothetical protein [Candidatus Bathyarchaeia archaeon]